MRLKGKIFKVGNSFGMRVPKTYIDDGNLHEGEEITVEIIDRENPAEMPLKLSTPSINSIVAAQLLVPNFCEAIA